MFAAVCGQRDRYRKRAEQLEAVRARAGRARVCREDRAHAARVQEKREAQEVLARLTLDIKTLRADNVKLYETLQYVRNYNAEKGNRKGRVRHGGAARGE